MTPSPSPAERPSPPQLDDDEIVITGLSGLFPACSSVKEFSEKLYNHENLVTKDKARWDFEHPELTEYCGVVPDLDKFDAQFFMVHYHLASTMDAMSRKLLEHAYQAIFDAGISPNEFSGSNMGVFIATHLTETEKFSAYTAFGFGIAGCNRAMFSNRISYLLNVKGPSLTIDAGCSGGLVCLEKAYEAIRRGDCESAIVGGCNIHLHPHSCINYMRMFPVNSDGKTKCFDKNADGQSMSECISVIFLQRAKDAKRIYATVCDVKSEFATGLSETGHFDNNYGPGRVPSRLSNFYNEFYRNANTSPLDVEYVEAFGSASPETDKAELEAIQDVFCKNRKEPLLIGSVMSNMGYSQASTAVAALTKVCLAYHTGKISANLHYETPHDDVPAICDGRMRVVTENKPFGRSYTAVNSMSLTGMNGHVLLKGRYKPKDALRYESKIPYLLAVSGRQESSVKTILDDVKSRPIDPEEIALLHNIHKTFVTKHLARGFTILKADENQKTVSVKEKFNYYDEALRPLWFVYSGMGSQWNGMGKELMNVPLFAAAIHRCQAVLKPKGVDLMHILTSDDEELFDNILNSFVGIAAVQIGLTDLLLSMGLVPDNIIGHSVGELACAYADGCLTLEQVILAAYYRGLVSVETPMIKGSMAAVGLGWQQIQTMCPHTIEVACHNAAGSSTISGPADDLHNFVDRLTKQGIFAKEVNCSNIAYHSRYIQDAGPALLRNLKTVIKEPKPRSKRWLSTSVPKSRWDEPAAQMCSAEYHTNNLLNPVLFAEASEAIPANAVLIEVAPHGLLQAILRRDLPKACTNIPLTRRGHSDNARYLLEAIGELYMSGYSPDLSVLYPKVEFPVSTETRPLSQLVEWVHTEKWKLPVYIADDRQHAAAYEVTLSSHDDEFSFLRGHIIDDETMFPFAGALAIVWDTLAMATKKKRKELSVHFQEVHFHTQPPLSDNRLMKLTVEIHRGNGRFQVVNENILIISGFIKAESEAITSDEKKEYEEQKTYKMVYNSNDVYRMFYDKGYGYRGEFRSIQKVNDKKTCALVTWNGNWVTFIDAVIQMNALRREGNFIEQPRFIQQLFINIEQHDIEIQSLKEGMGLLEAHYYQYKNTTRCGGVVLKDIHFGNITSHKRKQVGVKTFQFAPYFRQNIVDVSTAMYTMLQIIEENRDSTMNALDVTENENGSFLGNKIKQLLPELSTIKLHMKRMTKRYLIESKSVMTNPDFMLIDNLMTDKSFRGVFAHAFQPEIFLIGLEEASFSQSLYKVVASVITPVGRLVLGLWRRNDVPSSDSPSVISVTATQDINKLKMARNTMPSHGSLYILSQYPPIPELKRLVSQWRKQQNKNKVYLAMVDKTSIQNLEAKQLPDFDLAYSVLHNGEWGGYYYTRGARVTEKEQRAVALRSAQIGNLDSLQWIKTPEQNPQDIPVTVHYAGLNFYDAKKAVGDNKAGPEEVSGQHYGMDFSGVTARNERVMGIVSDGAAASRVAAQPSLLWPVPEHWTLEDAATVPLAYAHAYYCFGIKCHLTPGMTVLVHGGAGALGQAAISIALANRCTVFTTVSDIKKKRFLINMFPGLKEGNIGCSRDSTFGDMVMDLTRGLGCDIILSCVKGELKNITLSCCASSGTTLDTQEVHSKESYTYGMHNMTKCRSYVAIDFSAIFSLGNTDEMKQLQLMVTDGIASGEVRPLSRVVYRAQEAARGLRLLAASRHRGKVLLHIYGEPLLATKRLAVQPSGSSLVLASAPDDAFAVRVVDMLIEHGAVNIVFHRLKNREYKNNVYLDYKMKQWQKLGAKVKTTNGTLNGVAKVEELIKNCNDISPVDGIYMIADTPDDTAEETLSTLLVTLDNVSRRSCSTIRYFAIINNKADIGRNICINRKLDGMPALMLQMQNIDKFNETTENVKDISSNNNTISLRKVMPYVENALCLSEPVATLYTYDQGILMDIVFAMTNVNIKNETNDAITLHELGLKPERTQELYNLLQNYQVLVKQEEVPFLTVGKLKALQNNLDKSRVSTGLEVLYTYSENDEILSSYDLIFLPTLSQKSTMHDDGFDQNASYLVLVPGMDGHYGKFESLCKRLKLSAVVCQPGFDHPHETISQTAERMVKVLMKKVHPKGKFYLLGYSYGVLVALEMAAILEQHGMTGVVFCVDASPDTFPKAMDAWLRDAGATDNAKLETDIVQHMYALMAGKSSTRLVSELQRSTNWKERVEAGLRVLKEGGHSIQYARSVIETVYARIIQTRQYDSKQFKPLRSQLILLRCDSNSSPSLDLCLSRFSKLKPLVYYLLADHANALEDIRCANIVNRHLDKSILDDFQNMNHCISYICTAPILI